MATHLAFLLFGAGAAVQMFERSFDDLIQKAAPCFMALRQNINKGGVLSSALAFGKIIAKSGPAFLANELITVVKILTQSLPAISLDVLASPFNNLTGIARTSYLNDYLTLNQCKRVDELGVFDKNGKIQLNLSTEFLSYFGMKNVDQYYKTLNKSIEFANSFATAKGKAPRTTTDTQLVQFPLKDTSLRLADQVSDIAFASKTSQSDAINCAQLVFAIAIAAASAYVSYKTLR